MRSRPRRTRRPWASFDSAPISGTVQMGCTALACCAELVPTNQGSRPPAAHVSARRPIPASEFTQALDIQFSSDPNGPTTRPETAFYHRPIRSFVLGLFLPLVPFSATFPASRGNMVQRVATVAFEGIEARAVDVW